MNRRFKDYPSVACISCHWRLMVKISPIFGNVKMLRPPCFKNKPMEGSRRWQPMTEVGGPEVEGAFPWSRCVLVHPDPFCPVKPAPLRLIDQITGSTDPQPKQIIIITIIIIMRDLTRRTGVCWFPSTLLPFQSCHNDNHEETVGKWDKEDIPGRGIIGIVVRWRLWCLHPTSPDCSDGKTNPADNDYNRTDHDSSCSNVNIAKLYDCSYLFTLHCPSPYHPVILATVVLWK
jgi:hypothetical protein